MCEGRELPAYEAASEFVARTAGELDSLLSNLLLAALASTSLPTASTWRRLELSVAARKFNAPILEHITQSGDYPTLKSVCEGRELPAYEAASEFVARTAGELDSLLSNVGVHQLTHGLHLAAFALHLVGGVYHGLLQVLAAVL